MTTFTENFWGDKNNGFDVLYHNMKYGQDSSKEFADFLRESCTAEETYARSLSKLAVNTSKFGSKGSFSPYWQTVRALVEKLSTLHLQLVSTWQDLMKDVQRYTDEQHKKHKTMKDSESITLETVQSIQQTIVAVHKAKETYHARGSEVDKLRKDGNTSPKELEKAEVKFKKATDDYQALVDKYANVRNDFETRMLDSSRKFQELEEYHLRQMKDFVDTYYKAWEHQRFLISQVQKEFENSNKSLTVDHLLGLFVKSKGTGTEKPGPIEFIEADMALIPALGKTPDMEKKEFADIDNTKRESGDAAAGDTSSIGSSGAEVAAAAAKLDPPPPVITKSSSSSLLDGVLPKNPGWFLSKRKREKKKKKKKDAKEKGEKISEDSPKVDEDGCQIDEEGYRIRPSDENPADRDSWDSSSESDSDPSDLTRKINIEIKPLSNPNGPATNNTADLEKAAGGLRLSPTLSRRTPTMGLDMKKSTSLSDSMNSTSAEKPVAGDPFDPLSTGSTKPTGPVDYSQLGDLFSSLTGMSTTEANTSASTATSIFSSPVSANNTFNTTNSTFNTANNTFNSERSDMSILTNNSTPAPSPSPSTAIPRPRSQTPTTAAMGGPPPPARASRTSQQAGSQSAFNERADSVASLNSFSYSSVGLSRGPSPFTIGMSDTIPLAVSYSERVNCIFKGTDDSKCRIKINGEMMVSFPAGIIKVLTENHNPSVLVFRVKNTANFANVLVNKSLLREDTQQNTEDSLVYSFEMNALSDHLRKQMEKSRSASYFNIDILKYELRSLPGVKSAPLQLVSYWKCSKDHTDFRLDYLYNSSALATKAPLSNVSVILPVDGQVTNHVSKPAADWSSRDNRATWRLGELSAQSADSGRGCLRAKFDVSAGPSNPSQAAVQFLCEGHTISGVDFELVGTGYRTSLVKKRFLTGKYISESDNAVYV